MFPIYGNFHGEHADELMDIMDGLGFSMFFMISFSDKAANFMCRVDHRIHSLGDFNTTTTAQDVRRKAGVRPQSKDGALLAVKFFAIAGWWLR